MLATEHTYLLYLLTFVQAAYQSLPQPLPDLPPTDYMGQRPWRRGLTGEEKEEEEEGEEKVEEEKGEIVVVVEEEEEVCVKSLLVDLQPSDSEQRKQCITLIQASEYTTDLSVS